MLWSRSHAPQHCVADPPLAVDLIRVTSCYFRGSFLFPFSSHDKVRALNETSLVFLTYFLTHHPNKDSVRS